MAFKAAFFCAFAVLVQQTLAGPYYPKPRCGCSSGNIYAKEIEEIKEISYKPIAPISTGYSGNCVSIEIPVNGGAFAITSVGPIAPSGIAVATDLALGGDLALSGVLPYLSAVAFEGQFATSGAAPVAYGCGDIVAINEQIGGNNGAVASYGQGAVASYGQGAVGCYGKGALSLGSLGGLGGCGCGKY